MKIIAESDDATEFIELVEQMTNGILVHHAPEILFLIKIDNWFGWKWLGFAGKFLGAVGVWHIPYKQNVVEMRVPPFVPNRVISQRKFVAPMYEELDCGKPLHKRIPSRFARRRKVGVIVPSAALVWYSGNSTASGRGSIMAYVPMGESYWPWYAGFEKAKSWRIA